MYQKFEHASFTPVILSVTGGVAHKATFYKCLASLLAHKWGDDYSVVIGWLRCSLFSLLHSAIQMPTPLLDSSSTDGFSQGGNYNLTPERNDNIR